jgi:ribosome-associated translation inhibitor RaiA
MRIHVRTTGLDLTDADHAMLKRRLAKLERKLLHFQPDLADLELDVTRQPRRREFASHIRLVVMGQSLAASRNRGDTVSTLLRKSFSDLEEQMDRLNAGLRGERKWERKRGSRSSEGTEDATRALAELRSRMNAAMQQKGATGLSAFADSRLRGLRAVIYEMMAAGDAQPSDEQLDRALLLALDAAQRNIARKPEGWSIEGWLAWTAQRELGVRVKSSGAEGERLQQP